MKKKSLYNFYLDDNVKQQCIEKLELLNGKHEKGQLSALLRVLLQDFLDRPAEDCQVLLIKTELEYLESAKKNKRSKL